MAHEDTGGATLAAQFTQADLDRARAEGHAAGVDAGMKSERDRTAGILAHAEAPGREALANQCVAAGLTVEQAGAILGASAKAGTANAQGGFAGAMEALGNPNVQADASAPEALTDAHAIQESWASAFGRPTTAH